MRPQTDCYDYVRNYYKVPAYIGARVRVSGREGVLVDHHPSDQYLWIKFDGDKKPRGPYHPKDGIEFLDIERRAVADEASTEHVQR